MAQGSQLSSLSVCGGLQEVQSLLTESPMHRTIQQRIIHRHFGASHRCGLGDGLLQTSRIYKMRLLLTQDGLTSLDHWHKLFSFPNSGTGLPISTLPCMRRTYTSLPSVAEPALLVSTPNSLQTDNMSNKSDASKVVDNLQNHTELNNTSEQAPTEPSQGTNDAENRDTEEQPNHNANESLQENCSPINDTTSTMNSPEHTSTAPGHSDTHESDGPADTRGQNGRPEAGPHDDRRGTDMTEVTEESKPEDYEKYGYDKFM